MRIENVTFRPGSLTLETYDRDAVVFALKFTKPGEYEIRPVRKRRSLDANAYYWSLCGELADALHMTPQELYLRHIRDLGNYEVYCMQTKAVDDFKRLWCSDHLGRQVETRESKIEGCTTVLAYYGSSDFDTRQMSRLIDNCIQDCIAAGIETRPQEEIQALLEAWNERIH